MSNVKESTLMQMIVAQIILNNAKEQFPYQTLISSLLIKFKFVLKLNLLFLELNTVLLMLKPS